jgi:hypothetical protein
MTNDLTQLAEKLMLLRLCGAVINAHIEHLRTFNGWFPLGPMAPDYASPETENTRTIRLLEDATAEAQLLSQTAGDNEADMKAGIEQTARALEQAFIADNGRGIALAPAGNLVSRLSGDLLLNPGQHSVVERTLGIFKRHSCADATRDARAAATAETMLAALQSVGLYLDTERNAHVRAR